MIQTGLQSFKSVCVNATYVRDEMICKTTSNFMKVKQISRICNFKQIVRFKQEAANKWKIVRSQITGKCFTTRGMWWRLIQECAS